MVRPNNYIDRIATVALSRRPKPGECPRGEQSVDEPIEHVHADAARGAAEPDVVRDAAEDVEIPGLMHATVGGYHISDIEFTAAFDVTDAKVGLDLSEAI